MCDSLFGSLKLGYLGCIPFVVNRSRLWSFPFRIDTYSVLWLALVILKQSL
jgi:hypothetical protein